MKTNWRHIGTIADQEPFNINGHNIWNYEWITTGETITIKDPLYNKTHKIQVFEIQIEKSKIKFAAGEFSNLVWGIYQEQYERGKLIK